MNRPTKSLIAAFESLLAQNGAERIQEALNLFDSGESLIRQKQFTEAEKQLNEGLKTCPYHYVALYNHAICRIHAGDLQSAREDLCVALAVNPTYTNARKKLVAVLIELKLYQEAVLELEQIEGDDVEVEITALLGECSYYLGDYNKSAAYLSRYIERGRQSGFIQSEAWAREILGRCLLKTGRGDEALQELKKSLALFPDPSVENLLQVL